MKKLLALFLTLFLITTNAYAEWINYSSYNFFFYDNSSIKRNGNKVRVWNYNNVKPDDVKAKSMNIGSMRALDEIDCINETYTTLALDSYSKPNLEGDFETIKVSSKIDYIVPSSTHFSLMKLVCKK